MREYVQWRCQVVKLEACRGYTERHSSDRV